MPNIIDDQPPKFLAITDKSFIIDSFNGDYAITAIEPIVTNVEALLDEHKVTLSPGERTRLLEYGAVENDLWLVQCLLAADDVPSQLYIDAGTTAAAIPAVPCQSTPMPVQTPIDQVAEDEKIVAAAFEAVQRAGRQLAELRNLLKRHFPEASSLEIVLDATHVWVDFVADSDEKRDAIRNRLIANPCHGLPSFDRVHFDEPPHVSARIEKK